jgi:sugar/nucleoside kinase (ribokinase family)
LITNQEEALRLSGKKVLKEAMHFFRDNGTGAVIVTNGVNNVSLFSNQKSLFKEIHLTEMPVSDLVTRQLIEKKSGDTTGCGDNFAGGVIASLVTQLQNNKEKIDLKEACIWGIVSGGFSCFYMGGTYHQKHPGEKLKLLIPFYEDYLKQIDNE